MPILRSFLFLSVLAGGFAFLMIPEPSPCDSLLGSVDQEELAQYCRQ